MHKKRNSLWIIGLSYCLTSMPRTASPIQWWCIARHRRLEVNNLDKDATILAHKDICANEALVFEPMVILLPSGMVKCYVISFRRLPRWLRDDLPIAVDEPVLKDDMTFLTGEIGHQHKHIDSRWLDFQECLVNDPFAIPLICINLRRHHAVVLTDAFVVQDATTTMFGPLEPRWLDVCMNYVSTRNMC